MSEDTMLIMVQDMCTAVSLVTTVIYIMTMMSTMKTIMDMLDLLMSIMVIIMKPNIQDTMLNTSILRKYLAVIMRIMVSIWTNLTDNIIKNIM